MSKLFLLFPHQLFKNIELLKEFDEVWLIEEYLFFKQYKFHKQKLVLHRASMKYYEKYLQQNNIKVQYIEATQAESDICKLIGSVDLTKYSSIEFYDVCDDWLNERINKACAISNIENRQHSTHLFINNEEDLKIYFENKVKYFHTDFYIQQRKKLNILVDSANKPLGGKWSFDADNRHKYPKNKTAPAITFPLLNDFYKEAIVYVTKNFNDNYGMLSNSFIYPTTHEESEIWLNQFLTNRFAEFGEYEDAIVDNENFLHHSVLTPILNIGLLTPLYIIETTLSFAKENSVSLNSVEGFIRQIIGWREFIRGVYVYKGKQERTTNFWKFNKRIPPSYYNGTTGIAPIDTTIKKVLATGYCHHIERLMILGNFMLLNGFHPNQVYQWFMELFIDAYDWVMVPNIYGMSQFADGGLMATKPYISGSSYVLKMSNYTKGDWCEIWDALFWHFMDTHRDFFLSNPRLGMLIKTYDKMSNDKKERMEKLVAVYNKDCYLNG
jgi:deoxyribodipyrimidine photolyase-related protein